MSRYRYFATTGKGMEEVLAGEIATIGGEEIAVAAGGASFSGDETLGLAANLRLRTANRVLLHLSEFDAATPDDLYDGAKEIPWPDLFARERTIAVDASVRDSGITASHFAALKTKDAVVDRFREASGARPDVDPVSPDVRINVRIVRDRCTVSLDLSGESLNRRGYRTDPTGASLRETLAAGIVLLAGWDGRVPLVDPACGAGTLLIEAALIATETAPGLLRSAFGFKKLAGYDPKLWARLVEEARSEVRTKGVAPIEGFDVSPVAVRSAKRNAANAGVAGLIGFSVRDVGDLDPEEGPGVIVCNPPYGARMDKGSGTADFYRSLGKALKERCGGWTAWLLSGNPEATRPLRLSASRRIPLMNGPIDCRLLRYEIREPA